MKKISGSLKAAIGVAVLCGGLLSQQAGAVGVIEIDGSSTVYPITEAVAEEYQAAGGARVTVGISGTGGGFKRRGGAACPAPAAAAGAGRACRRA